MHFKKILCLGLILILSLQGILFLNRTDAIQRLNAQTSEDNAPGQDAPEELTDQEDSVPSEAPEQKKKRKKKKKKVSITISAAGDCTFGSDRISPASVNFYAVKRKHHADYFFKRVKKIFASDDLTIVNLEGTLTKRGVRQPKKFAFRGDPSYVHILKKGKIEAVSFANNHCRDFGQVSYQDTVKTVKKAGIRYASYSHVSTYKTKGKRVGMIAVCGLDSVGGSKSQIKSGIRKLRKKKADLIIVSMHAGIEHTQTVDAVQKALAHYAVDHGADLVLGHHPHVLQGIERYRGKYIAYSLGNFCFGGNTNPSDKDTMIYRQTFYFRGKKKSRRTKIKVIPCSLSSSPYINNYQPKRADPTRSARILARMKSYSPSVRISRGYKIVHKKKKPARFFFVR